MKNLLSGRSANNLAVLLCLILLLLAACAVWVGFHLLISQ